MLQEDNIIIIDVRSTTEFALGHLDNSINIPLDELEKNLHLLESNTKIITVCRSGARSEIGKNILLKFGYQVTNGGSWLKYKIN